MPGALVSGNIRFMRTFPEFSGTEASNDTECMVENSDFFSAFGVCNFRIFRNNMTMTNL